MPLDYLGVNRTFCSCRGAPAIGLSAGEHAAPPAAQGVPSPTNPAAPPPPPPPPELQVVLAPERVRFSAAPNSGAGGGRVLVMEQAVEAGERRRRDKHRGALQALLEIVRHKVRRRQNKHCAALQMFWLRGARKPDF